LRAWLRHATSRWMNSILITIAIIVAIALIHISYIDFRFRYRNGMHWFWMLNPAPPMMWFARATIIAAILASLATPFIGLTKGFAIVLGAIVLLHFVSLILLEVLEPR
jgi:hypothetical protein